MSMPRPLAVAIGLALTCGSAIAADGPGLGKPIAEADIKAWDIAIFPDGTNLPPGGGSAAQGARIYVEKCEACHGKDGKDGPNVALVGKPPLDRIEAPKSIANFWAHATTVFDMTRRAMPWTSPRTLTDDEVYALCAYILAMNKLIDPDAVMSAETLPKVKMPNRDNFIVRFPDLM
jgi:cytochrome c